MKGGTIMMPELYFGWLLSVLYHIHGHVDTVDCGIWKGACAFSYTPMSTGIHSLTKTDVTSNYDTWQCHCQAFFSPWHQMHPLPPSVKFKHIHSLGSVYHLSFATGCLLNFPQKNSITLSLACSFSLLLLFQIWSFVTSAIQSCVSLRQPSWALCQNTDWTRTVCSNREAFVFKILICLRQDNTSENYCLFCRIKHPYI